MLRPSGDSMLARVSISVDSDTRHSSTPAASAASVLASLQVEQAHTILSTPLLPAPHTELRCPIPDGFARHVGGHQRG